MKVSLNWVKKYVKLPENINTKEMTNDLTLRTVEVEDATNESDKFHDIIVGKILEINDHPNADKLRVCKVDIGESEPKQIVCGGKGCKVCNHNGWIEVMPGGVIHPNVLKSAGLDPEEWTGFYINIGLDRLVMMRYGVDDVRLFHSADLRFLKQFK